jgi:DNA-binding Lrp family transcriptional regulator
VNNMAGPWPRSLTGPRRGMPCACAPRASQLVAGPALVAIRTVILQSVQAEIMELVNLTSIIGGAWQEVVILQELDQTDRRILLELDEDPRLPVMLLAQKLGLARGTVHARLERMAASGALRPNSARLLPASLGRGVMAMVSAELDQSKLNDAVEALRGIPEVLECHAPAGDTDLLLRVVARSPDDLYRVSE